MVVLRVLPEVGKDTDLKHYKNFSKNFNVQAEQSSYNDYKELIGRVAAMYDMI